MRFWLRFYRAKNRCRGAKKGFTMVETLVVATLFSIVGLGIATSFISGMKLWNEAKNMGFSKYMFLLDMETVSRDLRQSIDLPTIGFEGSSQKVSFPALSGDSIVRVTYELVPDENALLRTEVNLEDIIAGKEQEKFAEDKIASWGDLSLTYFWFDEEEQAYVWVDNWEKEQGIFSAIKIETSFENEQITKSIFIPIS